MKQFLRFRFLLCSITLLVSFVRSNGQSVEKPEELRLKLGGLLGNNFRREGEDSVLISSSNGEIIALVPTVEKKVDNDPLFIGKIRGKSRSSFRFRFLQNKVEGTILDNSRNKAYTVVTKADGNLEVTSTDINNIVCVEYDTTHYEIEEPEAAVPISTSEVYKLQSNPASKSVAYLDFDGQVVSGTQWAGGSTINAVPGNFTEADIRNIFNLISEDFAPFNINITTDLAVFDAATRNSRIRCIFTPTKTAAPNAGGVAYLNSFTWGDDTPCWVFNSGVKGAGEAGTHEIGHTLGLRHDGRTTPVQDYFSGHGSWAPIMGTGYSKSIVHWSIGEYNYANNKQDDISVITSRNGFSFRTDDHGNTTAAASALVVESTGTILGANNKGIIERRTDVDYFKFTTAAGNISITASPAASYANLDIKLTLFDSQGTALTTANPTGLAATLTYNLTAGTYYLAVDGVGYLDPLTTGYSDYGSLGVYSMSGTIPVTGGTNILPNVSITTPAVGTSYLAPATISIAVNAQDLDGTIQKVEFFNGTTKLGEDLTTPFQHSWPNVAIGNYNLTARATDDKGGVTTSAIVAVVVKKPACQVANNQLFYDKIIGTSGSNNNNGFIKDFAFDGDSSTYFDSPTASGSWVGIELNGIYRITGIRYYPRASYLSRMNGGKFQGSNTPDFSANVVDLATLTATPLNEWNCLTINNSNSFKYVRYLSPTNSYGNVAEIEFYGAKTANLDPLVSITTPLNRSIVTIPTPTQVNVTASDPENNLSKVELYHDDEKIGEDASAPFQFTVQMDSSKRWVLIAKAIDNWGEYTLSDTVIVLARRPVCKIKGVQSSYTAILGTAGSLNNTGSTRDKAFDGDSSTFFNSPNSGGSWAGLDLGTAKTIVGVRFYPRQNFQNRMLNGRFQVASNATFTQGVVNIDTIIQVVNDEWNCIAFPRTYNYRYFRYLSASSSYGNIAELQLYLQEGSVTGEEDLISGTYGVKIYPNPAQHFVTIQTGGQKIVRIQIANSQGVVLQEYEDVEGGFSLPMGIANGLYHIVLDLENGSRIGSKLLVKN